MTNLRRNQTEILEGHSETLLTLPVRLMVLSVLSTPLGSSSFNLLNIERALSEMESGIGPANISAIEGTTRKLGGRAGTVGLSPLGTSSSPSGVGSVRSPGHRQLIPAPLAQQDNSSISFANFLSQVW